MDTDSSGFTFERGELLKTWNKLPNDLYVRLAFPSGLGFVVQVTDLIHVWIARERDMSLQFHAFNPSLRAKSPEDLQMLIKQVLGFAPLESDVPPSYQLSHMTTLECSFSISSVNVVWRFRLNEIGTPKEQAQFLRKELMIPLM